MARAIWTGSISFGLVNVPVKLYSAVHQQDIHFSQFDPSGNHIRYKRVSEKSGREVDYEDIQKGYEVGKGKWVMIDPKELEAFEPRATKTIDIEDFVALEDIDPLYYEHTYYLAADGEAAEKPYRLLLEAMTERGRVGIGKVVLRTKQYLAAVRPLGGVLGLSTMLFADEVVPAKEIKAFPSGGKARVTEREVELAEQIVDALAAEWKPEKYRDTYRDRVLEYIDRKAKGKELVVDEPDTEDAKVVDLMAALEASLAAARKGPKPASRSTKQTTKKATKTTKSGAKAPTRTTRSTSKRTAKKQRRQSA